MSPPHETALIHHGGLTVAALPLARPHGLSTETAWSGAEAWHPTVIEPALVWGEFLLGAALFLAWAHALAPEAALDAAPYPLRMPRTSRAIFYKPGYPDHRSDGSICSWNWNIGPS